MKRNVIIDNLIKTEYINGGNPEYGTGISLPSKDVNYDYVFTALHCVKGQNQKGLGTFKLYNSKKEEVEIYDFKIYSNEDLDIAIIKINKDLNLQCIDIKSKYFDAKCSIIGFPEHIECNYDEEEVFVKFNIGKTTIKVESEQIHFGRINATDVLGGLSGSPILIIEDNEYYVSGFINELQEKKFVYKNIIYADIDDYLKVIEDNNIACVQKHNIDILETCITRIYQSDEAEKLYSRVQCHANKLRNISFEPYINWLKEKMYLPYDKDKGFDIKIGSDVLKYFTYLYIISDNDFINKETGEFDEGKFYKYVQQKREDGIKYFYSYRSKQLSDILPLIFTDDEIFGDLKYNDMVITGFQEDNIKKDSILHSEIVRIVPNIYNGELGDELYEKGMDITSPDIHKNIDIYHICYFENLLVKNWNYEERIQKIDRYIKEEINGVIN